MTESGVSEINNKSNNYSANKCKINLSQGLFLCLLFLPVVPEETYLEADIWAAGMEVEKVCVCICGCV